VPGVSTAPDLQHERPEPGARHALEEALFEVKRVIVGQDAMLERLLVALLAGGHVLLEGVPGLAKTLTVKTVADVLGGAFKRIQFTPDLVPSDLVGTRVYRPGEAWFERPGAHHRVSANASDTEPVEMVVARSTQEAIVVPVTGHPHAPEHAD